MSRSPISSLQIFENFYQEDESVALFQRLQKEQSWPSNRYHFQGRDFVLPRLQTWHADEGVEYSYSNNLLDTRPWTPLLLEIRDKVEGFIHHSFNAVLVNLYRTGDDYVGWHADDEPELGDQPLIASLTLGATREFAYRHKKSRERGRVMLKSGTLLVMQPAFQHDWYHSVPVDETVVDGRINLTFRSVLKLN